MGLFLVPPSPPRSSQYFIPEPPYSGRCYALDNKVAYCAQPGRSNSSTSGIYRA